MKVKKHDKEVRLIFIINIPELSETFQNSHVGTKFLIMP